MSGEIFEGVVAGYPERAGHRSPPNRARSVWRLNTVVVTHRRLGRRDRCERPLCRFRERVRRCEKTKRSTPLCFPVFRRLIEPFTTFVDRSMARNRHKGSPKSHSAASRVPRSFNGNGIDLCYVVVTTTRFGFVRHVVEVRLLNSESISVDLHALYDATIRLTIKNGKSESARKVHVYAFTTINGIRTVAGRSEKTTEPDDGTIRRQSSDNGPMGFSASSVLNGPCERRRSSTQYVFDSCPFPSNENGS